MGLECRNKLVAVYTRKVRVALRVSSWSVRLGMVEPSCPDMMPGSMSEGPSRSDTVVAITLWHPRPTPVTIRVAIWRH